MNCNIRKMPSHISHMSREREVLEADVVVMFTAVAEATGDEVEVRNDLAVPYRLVYMR
jgi:hypothetical protein